MSALKTGFPATTLKVSNRASTQAQDFLILNLVVEGRKRMFWMPIELRSGTFTNVTVEFAKRVDSSELQLCGDHPVGIVDNPDPVATAKVEDQVEI
jgi:hypothetical protein